MKKFIIAAGLAVGLVLGASVPSEAATSVKIFFGFPHYSYKVGPDYRFRAGYGWYSPRYHSMRGLSCAQAKSKLRSRGYGNVSTVECNGATYQFRGTRAGNRKLIHVNARTGGIW